ncbi:hypothetical protein ACFWF9_19235, partial [Streptomyces roseolus]
VDVEPAVPRASARPQRANGSCAGGSSRTAYGGSVSKASEPAGAAATPPSRADAPLRAEV